MIGNNHNNYKKTKKDHLYFEELLQNERGFHRLYCELVRDEFLTLYYNRFFSEDPIFNHYVLDNSMLEGAIAVEPERTRSIVKKAKLQGQELRLSTSIFIEDFWPHGAQFVKSAVEQGYRITDKMETLTKEVQSTNAT